MNIIERIDVESLDYGIRLINAEKEWTLSKGENINVAIIDTGIDYTHVDLKDNFKGGITITSLDYNDYMDRCGHGTFCAGIIGAVENKTGLIGIAPKCNLYAVKALGDKGQGSVEWLTAGINWCIENDIDVINMSLGSANGSQLLYDAVRRAYLKNIIMVAAVGNDFREIEVEYPARYPEVIGVTAVDMNKKLGSFCTTGSKVELSAPGVNITSTYLNNKYACGSGTSFAAPHITGAIALIQSHNLKTTGKKLTLEELRKVLTTSIQDLGISGRDNQYGFGLFNF